MGGLLNPFLSLREIHRMTMAQRPREAGEESTISYYPGRSLKFPHDQSDTTNITDQTLMRVPQ